MTGWRGQRRVSVSRWRGRKSQVRLAGFRFELLDRDGKVVAERGDLTNWVPKRVVLPPDGKPHGDRFRTGALWCAGFPCAGRAG